MDLVYLDPDTGLPPPSMAGKIHQKAGTAYADMDDIAAIWKKNHSLVVYQDATQGGNSKLETIRRKIREIQEKLGDAAEVIALRWTTGSGRVYFIVIQQKHHDFISDRVRRLLEGAWAGYFRRVPQDGAPSGY